MEFQHRCSPHIHMLVWIKESPTLDMGPTEQSDVSNNSEITTFIDRYISCSLDVCNDKKEFVKLKSIKTFV